MNKSILFLLPLLALLTSCSAKSTYTVSNTPGMSRNVAIGYSKNAPRQNAASELSADKPSTKLVKPEGMIPPATAFRMSGDYAGNVGVTLDPAGNLTYFPAPSDINANSAPVDLGNGWWLNRQGLSANSVFTSYTFRQYAELGATPSPAEIKAAVIPGARVVEMVQLPYNVSAAAQHIPEIKEYLDKL